MIWEFKITSKYFKTIKLKLSKKKLECHVVVAIIRMESGWKHWSEWWIVSRWSRAWLQTLFVEASDEWSDDGHKHERQKEERRRSMRERGSNEHNISKRATLIVFKTWIIDINATLIGSTVWKTHYLISFWFLFNNCSWALWLGPI